MELKLKKVLEDQDVMNAANYAASGYSSSLTKDEIENCIYNAIWCAVNKFDESRKVKFTTYLHKGVRLQCQKRLKFNKKYKTGQYENFFGYNDRRIDNSSYIQDLELEMKDEIENCEDPDILYDRFYNNMTLSEIAIKKNTSYETVRNRINKNLKLIKNRIS